MQLKLYDDLKELVCSMSFTPELSLVFDYLIMIEEAKDVDN